MGECVNCSGPAATAFTLEFATGHRLTDLAICARCHAFFDRSDRVAVHDQPILVRGGGAEDE